MNNLDLYISLPERRLVTGPAKSTSPKLPPFVQGDRYRVILHFLEAVPDSRTMREVRPDFETIKLGLGYIDAPPTSGTFRIKHGEQETTDLAWNVSKNAFATALNALGSVAALGGVSVAEAGAPNIFQVRWNNTEATFADTQLSVVKNRLAPKCFARVSHYQTDSGWLQFVKVFQAPIAFVDHFAIPTPPPVTCGVARSGTGTRNAVLTLNVPAAATGSFDLVWNGLSTTLLRVATLSTTALGDALNALFTDGVNRFGVSNPREGVFYIECLGPLGLAPQAPFTVTMHDQESGTSPTGLLSLDVPGAELLLDGRASVGDLSLECELVTTSHSQTLFQVSATLLNDMLDSSMLTAEEPGWLEELEPEANPPHDRQAEVVGVGGYVAPVGDSIALVWTLTHNLGTLNVHVTVRDTQTNRRVPDNEYAALLVNENQVRITFAEPPEADRYTVIVSSADSANRLLEHGHPIDDIEGLRAALNALAASGNPLELWPQIPLDKLPEIPFSKFTGQLSDNQIPESIPRLDADGFLTLGILPPEVPRLAADGSLVFRKREETSFTTLLGAGGKLNMALLGDLSQAPGFVEAIKKVLGGGGANKLALSFALPQWIELYPGRATSSSMEVAASSLPKPGGLLPAIHDAASEALPTPLPAASASLAGRIFQNQTGADFRLSGGLGRAGTVLKAGDHVACDGRLWYRVAREGTTTTWHPQDFERELVLLDVNEAMLPIGAVFTLLVDFQTQILRSETRAQWVLLLEHGTFNNLPSPSGTNISGITWATTPLVACPLRLTPIRTPHLFGVRVSRQAGGLTTETRLYRGSWMPSETTPATANFALRARLARFDTEDHLADPRGYVLLAFNPEKNSLATIV
jgi:hypothetical protein